MEASYEIKTMNVNDTQSLAKKLAKYLKEGDVITLEGDLGAGKTSFTQGLAQGLGINQIVNSPTFTLIKEYQGELPLYHMDVYRLEGEEEDLGFDDYFYGDGISVIEWAQFIADYLPKELLNIMILKQGETERLIRFEPKGQHYIELCKEFFKHEDISN